MPKENEKSPVEVIREKFEETRSAADSAAESAKRATEAARSAEKKAETLGNQLEETRSKLEDAEKKLEDLRQAQIRSGRVPGGGAERAKSLGQRVVESEKVAEGLKTSNRNLPMVSVKSPARRSAITSDNMVVDNPLRPGSVDAPRRHLVIRDLMTVIGTTGDTIRYSQEIMDKALCTDLKAEAASGQNVLQVRSIAGFYPNQAILVGEGTANEESHTVQAVNQPEDDSSLGTLTLVANLANTHSKYTEITATTFKPTKENEYKPVGKFKEKEVTAPIVTLASGFSTSNQILQDSDRLAQKIDQKLPRNLDECEEDQILYGTGADGNLLGLMNHTAVQRHSWSQGESRDTMGDAIARGANKVRLAKYMPSAVVIHPTDLLNLKTSKDADGRYIYPAMFVNGAGEQKVMNLAVVESQSIRPKEALVGAFDIAATLYDREMTDVRIFESHKDYAERNMVYVRGERRIGLTIERPQAFCKINFDNQPA